MPCGPYDMWPRVEEQYEVYVKLAEYVMNVLKADIVIFHIRMDLISRRIFI